eukprot:COSAG01_NODE_17986_length_1108_cov_1.274529_2_plen_98_part_01
MLVHWLLCHCCRLHSHFVVALTRWAGHGPAANDSNAMLLGGALKGGVIHGAFPTDLTKHGPLILSRGRIIPSTPWEALWHGVCEWMGVHASLMTEVLP